MVQSLKEKKIAAHSSLYNIINVKLIAYIIGILLCVEGGFFLICMCVSLFYQESSYIHFLISAGINASIGTLLMFYGRKANTWMTRRDGYCIVSLTWLVFTILGMLPFYLSGEIPSITDAFFETMSGFTTTGSTILNDIDNMPHGMLFWRSLTQWIGGLGIMCFTIAVLPIFSGSNMQLFSAEATGVIHDKIHPKISITTKLIWTVYIILTASCAGLLYVGGMNIFDSICHAFTATSTGGYSTRQASIAYWNSPFIDYSLAIIMVIASLSYPLLALCLQGKFKKLWQDGETRWFLGSVTLITVIITIILYTQMHYPLEKAFRNAFFQVVTIHSSGGFATDDYCLWPQFTWMLLLLLMLAGGCTGSTAGGIKSMRIMLLFHNILNEFKKLIHPNAVLSVRINKHVVPHGLLNSVTSFTLFYFMCSIIGCLLLLATGMDFIEAVSSSISALGNTGIALGHYGPAYTMSEMPVIAKWIMSFLMLIGRLELFSVLLLFCPVFWKEW